PTAQSSAVLHTSRQAASRHRRGKQLFMSPDSVRSVDSSMQRALFGTSVQAPSWHVEPMTQSASVRHVVMQPLSSQAYGAQSMLVPSPHAPLPLQTWVLSAPVRHLSAPQDTRLSGYEHSARSFPSQEPAHTVWPPSQLDRSPCGAPVTGTHLPR